MQTEKAPVYFKHLDGVRTIAVLMVVFHHWYTRPTNFHLSGAMGVGLFFVLSGFLISNILLKQQAAFQSGVAGVKNQILKTFYLRRTLRIFPIYYVYVGGLLLLGIGDTREIWGWLVGYAYNLLLFITNNWYNGYVEHLWSLAIEEQYYLIWPILFLSCPPKWNYHLVFGFILLSMATKAGMYLQNPASQYSKFPLCQFDSFGIGSLLALLLNQKRRIPYAGFLMWVFWTITVAIKLRWFHFPGLSFIGQVFPFFFIGCVLYIHEAVEGFTGPASYFYNNRFVIYLGKISYGIYLYHLFVPDLIKWLFFKVQLPLPGMGWLWVIYSLVTLGICSFSWYAIEQPVNRLKDRYVYKAR